MEHHLEAAKEWARDSSNLRVHARGSKSAAACVQVAAELPLPPREAFELMSHPDNAAIFRGIERCTFRRVLWAAAGDGRQTVEVENESDWHFLFMKGSIRTRMLVHEDPTAGTIHVRLAPAGGNAPLQHMSAKWRFAPGKTHCSCQVSLDQEVHPKGLPPFFHNAFRAMAALQARKTLEDFYAEALRMNAGCPSLAPYASVAHKEIVVSDTAEAAGDYAAVAAARALAAKLFPTAEDPSSVLAYEDESSSSTSGSGGSGSGRCPPRGGLRSHPIGSLLDLACLAGATGASIAAEVAAHAAHAAAAGGAAAAGQPDVTWRGRLYTLVQKLWLVSNAALGLAPNAVAELEEMAVLV